MDYKTGCSPCAPTWCLLRVMQEWLSRAVTGMGKCSNGDQLVHRQSNAVPRIQLAKGFDVTAHSYTFDADPRSPLNRVPPRHRDLSLRDCTVRLSCPNARLWMQHDGAPRFLLSATCSNSIANSLAQPFSPRFGGYPPMSVCHPPINRVLTTS